MVNVVESAFKSIVIDGEEGNLKDKEQKSTRSLA